MRRPRVYVERTNLRTYLLALVVAVIGGFLVVIAELALASIPWLQVLLRDLGALLIASVAVAILWELFSRRALLAELLAETNLVEDIEATGLIRVSEKWQGEVDWPSLFNSSDTFSCFFMYARTWRNSYRDTLSRFSKKPKARATVVLPDPDLPMLMAHLAARIGVDTTEMEARVRQTASELQECFSSERGGKAELSIWYAPIAPVFSYYKFDNIAVFTLYKHSIQKVEVPTFTVRKGGTLYEFLSKDFESLVDGPTPLARRVFSNVAEMGA